MPVNEFHAAEAGDFRCELCIGGELLGHRFGFLELRTIGIDGELVLLREEGAGGPGAELGQILLEVGRAPGICGAAHLHVAQVHLHGAIINKEEDAN